MRKILIVLPSFQLGGTNTAFNNLLSFIKDKFEIDVFAFDNSGSNLKNVASLCNVIGYNANTIDNEADRKTTSTNFTKKCIQNTKRSLKKIGIDISFILFIPIVHRLSSNHYDFVIAFQEGQVTRFVSYFRGVLKIAWVHCDYSNHLKISSIKPEHNVYENIDRIVCVSSFTASIFKNLLPETGSKIEYLYNVLDVNSIKEKSEATISESYFKDNKFVIVSIGRIDPVKRFHVIPSIAKKIKESTSNFIWLIMGDGDDTEKLKILAEIERNDVADIVIPIGPRNNPYPYIKRANLLVSTSLSEACPTVINEAMILHTPVVSTDYGSALEFIDNNVNGYVCSIDSMSDIIKELLTDRTRYRILKDNISSFVYCNDDIINKLQSEIFC